MTREEPAMHFLTVAECSIYRSAPVQRDYMALGVGAVPGMGAVGRSFLYCSLAANSEGGTKTQCRKKS